MIMGALMMGNLLQEFIADSSQSMEDRLWVWNRFSAAVYTWPGSEQSMPAHSKLVRHQRHVRLLGSCV